MLFEAINWLINLLDVEKLVLISHEGFCSAFKEFMFSESSLNALMGL
jgi:hypothetical protein